MTPAPWHGEEQQVARVANYSHNAPGTSPCASQRMGSTYRTHSSHPLKSQDMVCVLTTVYSLCLVQGTQQMSHFVQTKRGSKQGKIPLQVVT